MGEPMLASLGSLFGTAVERTVDSRHDCRHWLQVQQPVRELHGGANKSPALHMKSPLGPGLVGADSRPFAKAAFISSL